MADFVNFMRWLIEYSLDGGFWHFISMFVLLSCLSKFTTLVKIDRTAADKIKALKDARDAR